MVISRSRSLLFFLLLFKIYLLIYLFWDRGECVTVSGGGAEGESLSSRFPAPLTEPDVRGSI